VNITAAPKIDTELVRTAALLRQRAESLRSQADALSSPLASAYRRRASELELQAWLDELAAGVPYDEIQSAA
jgi:hypothetical protein